MNAPDPAASAISDVPTAGVLAALASLQGLGPARASRLLTNADPHEAWEHICTGHPSVAEAAGSVDLARAWRAQARRVDPGELLGELRAAGVGAIDASSAAYPMGLLQVVDPPPLLFFAGDLGRLAVRSVAIVGTRQCTVYGLEIAFELGQLLARAGVSVVSGLAAGIDAAAHAGAIEGKGAAPVAVVASGVDTIYPLENAALWRRVSEVGIVMSEAPLGTKPDRWRFPARNRIIAGLSDLVVVVESHLKGGSLYTAAAAIDADRPVFAVPGPIRSAASAGSNALLADGCHPLCALGDVLEVLELVNPDAPDHQLRPPVLVSAEQHEVLDAIAWQPTSLDDIVSYSGLDLGLVATALVDLGAAGVVVRRGRWYERCAVPIKVGVSDA